MHKGSPPAASAPSASARARLVFALVLIGTMTGCARVSDWLRGGPDTEVPPVEAISDAPLRYLSDMSQLAGGDPAIQADIFADAAAAARIAPDPGARLRLALVLATPGHPGSDPQLARTMLRELLAETELLTPMEESLAMIHLHEVQERLLLNAEARRLREEQMRDASNQDTAAAQRLADVESENRQLRQSLAEAEEKLEAITSIERSIRQQSDNDNGQR